MLLQEKQFLSHYTHTFRLSLSLIVILLLVGSPLSVTPFLSDSFSHTHTNCFARIHFRSTQSFSLSLRVLSLPHMFSVSSFSLSVPPLLSLYL